MGDLIGKILVMLVGFTMIFYVPVMVISLKQDTTTQAYVDNAVVEFIDDARGSAQITPLAYETMARKVYAALPNAEIEIYHEALYLDEAAGSDAGVPGYGGFDSDRSYNAAIFNKDDILAAIYGKDPMDGGTGYYDDEHLRNYELKNGDHIKVVAYNTTPTLGGRLLGVILPRYDGRRAIFASYGGYVGNNMQTELYE